MNLFDRSLVPWGLLRTGVAPDHPEVKHTAQAWSSIGDYETFKFYGGVEIGKQTSQFKSSTSQTIDLSTLIANHDAVLLANGAYEARSLNLCQSTRIISAQDWVISTYNFKVSESILVNFLKSIHPHNRSLLAGTMLIRILLI